MRLQNALIVIVVLLASALMLLRLFPATTVRADEPAIEVTPPTTIRLIEAEGAYADLVVHSKPEGGINLEGVDTQGQPVLFPIRQLRVMVESNKEILIKLEEMRLEIQELKTALATMPANPAPAPTLINVNTAPATLLLELPGVGPVLAEAIIAEREDGGPFVDAKDLMRVPGIGRITSERLAPHVRFNSPE